MRTLLYTLSIALFLVSCNNSGSGSDGESSKDAVAELKLEVIQKHDEIMPKLGDMNSLMTMLKRSDRSNIEDSLNILKGYNALKSSQEEMMIWMREFKHPEEQDWTEAEKLEYLNQEKQKIEKVGFDVEEAMAFSNQLLQQLATKEEK